MKYKGVKNAMTQEELSQLRHLNKEVELLQWQIAEISPRISTDSVKGSLPEFPYTAHPIIITGMDYNEYDRRVSRLRNSLKRRMGELLDKVTEVNEYIDTVPDSEMRMILTLRYVNGLSWNQVALHIGEYDESYPRRKHNKFLKVAENAEK